MAPPPPPRPVVETQPAVALDAQKRELRMNLFRELNDVMPALDTPRGLVVTIGDSCFHEADAGPAVYDKVSGIAQIVRAQAGLTVEVEGYGPFSDQRAYAVRDLLTRAGVAPSAVYARGLGDSRPLVSNATPAGREQNRRVEIVISGSPIGQTPYWTRAYTLAPPAPAPAARP